MYNLLFYRPFLLNTDSDIKLSITFHVNLKISPKYLLNDNTGECGINL